MEVGPGDFVLDGDTVPLPKFSTHLYHGKTAGWIKMVIGMEVGLSPGDFVLDGDPDPLATKGPEPPLLNFRASDSCLMLDYMCAL